MWNWLVKFAESGAPVWVLLLAMVVLVIASVIKAAFKMSPEQIDARTRRWLAKQWVRRSESWRTRMRVRLLDRRSEDGRED